MGRCPRGREGSRFTNIAVLLAGSRRLPEIICSAVLFYRMCEIGELLKILERWVYGRRRVASGSRLLPTYIAATRQSGSPPGPRGPYLSPLLTPGFWLLAPSSVTKAPCLAKVAARVGLFFSS
jgi:hypothetical protein